MQALEVATATFLQLIVDIESHGRGNVPSIDEWFHGVDMWKKQPAPPGRAVTLNGDGGRWHAVSIRSERYCCAAARELASIRFLAAFAPRLPLGACPAAEDCGCKYKHHTDRRGMPRRKEDISGIRRRDPNGEERRVARDRRESDML